MNYIFAYHPFVKTDLAPLSEGLKSRIRSLMYIKLARSPELFGVPLRTSLRGYRVARVTSHRIVYRIQKSTIFIVAIKHYLDIR